LQDVNNTDAEALPVSVF